MRRGTQVKREGLAITEERRGTSVGIAFRHLSCPLLHVRSAKDHTERETAPRCVGFRGRTLKTIRTEVAHAVPTQAPVLITPEEPWVLITLGGQSVDFLLDTGAAYSVFTEAPGPLSSQSASIMGLSGWAKRYYFTWSLSYNWDCAIFTRVSDHARSPSLHLGRDIQSKVHASVFMNMEPSLSLPLIEQNVNPRVWADGKSVGRAQTAVPVVAKLKDLHLFPHKK